MLLLPSLSLFHLGEIKILSVFFSGGGAVVFYTDAYECLK